MHKIKHEIFPESLILAAKVMDKWDDMMPRGHMCACPPKTAIALIIDVMRHYRLVDNAQEKAILTVVGKLASKGDTIESIIESTTFSTEVPWLSPNIEDFDDLDCALDRHGSFMSPQSFLAALSEESNAGQQRSKHMSKLAGLAHKKLIVKPTQVMLAELRLLAVQMPNFSAVLDDIIVQISARLKLNLPMRLQPMLLLGKPGIGKTRFIKKLAQALTSECHVFNMGGNSDSMRLKGLYKGWGNSRPGELATKLAQGTTFNPIFMLDEIEKAKSGRDSMHDVPGLLLSYLERESNNAIEDDYIAEKMDLSMVNWVFAANSIDDLPDYFLSRVDVYSVPEYTVEQKRDVIVAMFEEISTTEFNGHVLYIDPCAVQSLVGMDNAREVRRQLFKAIASAIGDASEHLSIGHLGPSIQLKESQSMGFY